MIVLLAGGLGYWLIQTPAGALLGFDLHGQKSAEIPVFPGAVVTDSHPIGSDVKRGGDSFAFYKVDPKVPKTEVKNFYKTELEKLGWKQDFKTYLVRNDLIEYSKGGNNLIVSLECKRDPRELAVEVGSDVCYKESHLIVTVVYFN